MKKLFEKMLMLMTILVIASCSKEEGPDWGGNDGSINGSIVYYGKANSVIASEAGDYAVDATPYYSDKNYRYTEKTKETLTKATKAAVIWQTKPNLLSDVLLDASQTEVKFSVNELGGNALIALYDAAGTVLWSFHIWCTEQPKDCYYQNGYIVMDRNLGASSFENSGMLYQWGRKDPFGSNQSETLYDADGINRTQSWETDIVNISAATGTIVYAIQHPTTFISATGEVIPGKHDKYYNDYDWYYAPDRNNKLWQESKKSIYDPCPEGYRVSNLASWQNNFTAGGDKYVGIDDVSTNDNYHWATPIAQQVNAEGMVYDTATKKLPGCDAYGGIKFYYQEWGKGNTTFIPYTTSRMYNGEYAGATVYWTTTPASKSEKGSVHYYKIERSDKSLIINPYTWNTRSSAHAVRCIKDI